MWRLRGKNQKRHTEQKVQSVFQNSVSKDPFSKPPRLHRQGHRRCLNCLRSPCVKTEKGAVKYTLGNSLRCRHLMEKLLGKDYAEEQMCNFVFQLTQKHSLSTCKSNSTKLNGFSFQQSACSSVRSVTDFLFHRSACLLPRCISGVTKRKHEGCLITRRIQGRFNWKTSTKHVTERTLFFLAVSQHTNYTLALMSHWIVQTTSTSLCLSNS